MSARDLMTVASGTAASRLLGFVRDMLIAATLGSGAVADAFVTAFRLPNLFRRLLSEGALNPSFVPLYERLRGKGGEAAASAFASQALVAVGLALAAFVALAQFGMGLAVWLLAPGFADDPQKFALAVELSRYAFPFLLFSGLSALLAALLNARGRFVEAAFAALALNIVLVAALAFVWIAGLQGTAGAARALSVAVSLGGAVQFALCLRGARMSGAGLAWRWPEASPEMRSLGLLALPGILASGVAQVNAFVGSVVGSAEPGAVSYLYFADRVYQLPLGVVGVAIGVVLLPDLTRRLVAGDVEGARRAQTLAIDFALAVSIPAAVALSALSGPIVDVLFRRGAFDAQASAQTAVTLAAFAIGLPGYVLTKALQTAFFARGAMRAPFIVALTGAALDIALSLSLFPSLKQVGIALAASAAGWLNALVLLALLAGKGDFAMPSGLVRRAGLILLVSLAMGAGLAFARDALFDDGAGFVRRLAVLAALCAGGMAFYAALGHALGAFDLRAMRGALKR